MSSEQPSITPRLIPSTRFTLAVLIPFAFFTTYAQRVSLSMAIVCMANKNNTTSISTKYGSQFLKEKQFFLTEFQQQILLGAHLFGCLFTLMPGNKL
jgi:hypothetical protein